MHLEWEKTKNARTSVQLLSGVSQLTIGFLPLHKPYCGLQTRLGNPIRNCRAQHLAFNLTATICMPPTHHNDMLERCQQAPLIFVSA